MISIAICDDAKELVEKLEGFIKLFIDESGEEIGIQKYYSGESLLGSNHSHIDLVFLDIHMPGGMNGLKTAQLLREKNKKISIIFLTSLIQYALEGYKVQAYNYILKPVAYKVIKKELEVWIQKNRVADDPYILVHNNSGEYKICLKALKYIETYKRNLLFHTAGEEIICYKKMRDIEQELKEHGFFRCHVGYLLNMLYVDTVEKLEAKLVTGEIIPIAKLKRKDFMVSLADFWGRRI